MVSKFISIQSITTYLISSYQCFDLLNSIIRRLRLGLEMAPSLEHCMTMRGYLSKENTIDLQAIKNGPQRIVVPVTSGFIKGTGPAEGLEAEILPSSGDWLLVRFN